MTTSPNPLVATHRPKIAILGGGPGGYEAALVAARLGADVTIIERRGLGGSTVLTDVVPSKTLIATAEWMTLGGNAAELGIRINDESGNTSHTITADLGAINQRIRALAATQSADIEHRIRQAGIQVIQGRGKLLTDRSVAVSEIIDESGASQPDLTLEADAILVSVGATPRVLPDAQPDGRRILTWTQLYNLTELPQHLIVVGSGVTGAEFAGAYHALGADVTLVSSRDRVLPGEDEDAANLIEEVFKSRGMTVLSKSRAQAARVVGVGDDEHVEVTLSDGQVVTGSHVLMAVGSVPNTQDIGLEEVGVAVRESGHIVTDKVSRTSVRGIYAAGDCTGVFPLASVAGMQGRIAMSHALGDTVNPIKLRTVAANIFTAPEIANVGYTQKELLKLDMKYTVTRIELKGNARAKMMGIREGFVKLFSRTESGTVVGGVIVAPRASELIYPITLAVQHRLTVDEVAGAFTVYPSLTGTIAEAALQGHRSID
ncbi:NAD(P)H-quinone dehydrogenase [Populibacterium corticicola]|uniref:NAD(P)H-quinone dehydrogenase n=1 Tax=Populibacterium corticicola TaxID=1812826 RepID=A0ABW5XHR6_9MICO